MRAFRRLRNFLADAARLAVALVVLNARKTAYRIRPGRRHPCQHPSDSGRAGETHCEAVIRWDHPSRFRRVCPALRMTRDGPVCSLNAADVRPYWGRAVLIYAAAALTLALAGASAGYIGLRAIGYRDVRWVDVAWPPRWREIGRARSRYFLAHSVEALAQGNVPLARLSLESALKSDPTSFQPALLLATLDSVSSRGRTANAWVGWALANQPQRAERVAVTLHDMMLQQGQLERVADFALWMARRDRANAALWVRSLLTVLRATRSTGRFARLHAAEVTQLARPARSLMATQILAEEGRRDAARLALQRPLAPDQPIYGLLQVEQLLRLGDTAAAEVVAQTLSPALGRVRALGLQYWIAERDADAVLAHACFDHVAAGPLAPGDVDWLAAMVIRAPDPASFRRLDRRLRASSADLTPDTAAGIWAAAVVCADREAARYWAERVRKGARTELPHDFHFDFGSASPARAGTVPAVLTHVALPREVIDALLARVRVAESRPGR